MNEYQENLFVVKVQELLVHLKVCNDDAQWSPLELYYLMDQYIKLEKLTSASAR